MNTIVRIAQAIVVAALIISYPPLATLILAASVYRLAQAIHTKVKAS